ncbi:MAG TPA: hypothetical protein VIE41_04220 [Methylomirabilota bacterium]
MAAAGLLAAALAGCYAPVVFAGKSLQGPLYTTSPILPGGPWNYAGRRPANTFDVDIATPAFYEWPLDHFVGQVLRRGELPLWNPHQGTGIPMVANYSTRVFFPFQVLMDLSPVALWDFFSLLRLWIAGMFTYAFLARAGLGWPAAILGAIAYMLSGAFVWFINLEQYVNTAMIVPIWFLAVERFVVRPDARRGAGLALAVGLILLAGQPEIAFYALVAGGLYGIARWITGPPTATSSGRAVVWAVGGVVLGFALAAAQLLPFAAHLPQALHLHQAGGDMGVRDPAPGFLGIQVFVPSFYELPTALRIRPDNGRWDFLGGYAGTLTVFLSVAGLVVPPWRVHPSSRPPLIFFGSVAAWLLLKNFGVPPFDWIGYLPLFEQVWTPRWAGPIWGFALASAAAFGLERLTETDMTAAGRARLAMAAAGVLVLLGALAGAGFTTLAPVQDTLWSFIWPGALGGSLLALTVIGLAAVALGRCSGAAVVGALLGLLLIERWFPIPRGYAPLFLALRLVPIGCGLVAVAFVIIGRRTLAVGSGVVAIALALALDPIAPVGLPDRVDPAEAPPVIRFLRERADHGRIMGHRTVLAPNYASVFGLYDVRHVDALSVAWFHGYVQDALETEPRRWWHALWFIGDPERATGPRSSTVSPLEEDLRARLRGYSLAGVRYIVAPRGMDLNRAAASDADRFPLVYDHEVLVYENRDAFPRAFAAARWESVPDAIAARTRALALDFDPRRVAVIEGGAAGSGHDGAVRIVDYGATRLRLSVEMNGPGLVVLTDTFYPGWEARVDGQAAAIHRVDGLFRGVFVEGGRHEITMRFRPSSQSWGLALSAAGLAAVVALIVVPARERPSPDVVPLPFPARE